MLNTIERRVFSSDSQLEISPKAFDVLLYLVENYGVIISKDELMKQVWEDSFVEEGNLAVHISKLRKLLGADKANPYIETVSGTGYRFVSRVNQIDEEQWNRHVAKNAATEDSRPDRDFDSIAVLPLKNENGDEEMDYLADGLTETLINNLSYTPDLRVLARNTVFEYKNKEIDVQKTGRRLGVDTILTGRIRVIRDNLVIGVELINTADGTQLWGSQLNQPFEDIFEIQELITKEIIENLKSHISGVGKDSLAQSITENTESYRLYLKGKYLLNKKTIIDVNYAISYFQQSISLDPQNIHSYIELSYCYLLLYWYEQITYKEANRIITSLLNQSNQLNKEIAELYDLKGVTSIYFNFDFNKAEKYFKQAINLNSNLISAYKNFSKLLVCNGSYANGIDLLHKILELDPLSLQTNKTLARFFYFMEQYDSALIRLEECLELEPRDYQSIVLYGTCLTELGRYAEAINFFEKALSIQNHDEVISMIGYTYARSGNPKKAISIVEKLKQQSESNVLPGTYLAIIYAALEENEKVFNYLQKAYDQRHSDLIALKVDPRFKTIRNDPRFKQFIDKIGFS